MRTAASSISPIPRSRNSGTMAQGYATGVNNRRQATDIDAGKRRLEGADDRGVALAATTAQRGRADPTAAAAQLVDECEHHARARHPDRVAERDRAAVHVHDVVADAEVLHRRESDRGE